MGLVEKAQANAPAAPVAELERFRLRRFVEGLDEDLDTVHAATDLADVAGSCLPSMRCARKASIATARGAISSNQ
jgi:hypothetical protein